MAVADASPLILLAKVELLETFLDDFPGEVLIPPHVQVECCENKDTFDAQLISRLIKEKRIVIRKLKTQAVAQQLRKEFNLGKGEAEAVALAQATKSDLVFIEDKKGVDACKILRLPFTGVLGILLRMREKGVIVKEEALRKLEILQKSGRYKSVIIADVKRRLEGKK
jgi:predicted nucleic acid-binding protein